MGRKHEILKLSEKESMSVGGMSKKARDEFYAVCKSDKDIIIEDPFCTPTKFTQEEKAAFIRWYEGKYHEHPEN